MAIGRGKYYEECRAAAAATKGQAAFLIVLNGKRGSGFACETSILDLIELPRILRNVADQIEADHKQGRV